MDKIQLSPLPEYDNRMCLLSAPPHDPECRILVLIDETRDDDTNVEAAYILLLEARL